MALFGSKKNTEKEASKPKEESKPKGAKMSKVSTRNVSHVLRQPRITEKATFITGASNVYAFEVDPRATKRDISLAMQAFYKVTPIKVNIVAIPSKKVIVRGKRGVKSGGKKAYVFLKEGENIEVL